LALLTLPPEASEGGGVAAVAPAAVLCEGDDVLDVEDDHPLVLVLGVEEDQLDAVDLLHVRRAIEDSDHLSPLAGKIVESFLF
jgi:hypothetical protein